MKKALIFLILAIPAIRGVAQYTITPELGYNKSIFNNNAQGLQISTKALDRFQIGALISRNWKKGLFLQSGLQFAQKGSYQGRGPQALYGSNTDIKINYLQAPLNAGIRIKLHNDFGVILSAGVYLAYGISGTEKGTSQDINGSGTVDRSVTFSNDVPTSGNNSKTYIRPFDEGYNLSAGLFYKSLELKTVYSKGSPNVSPTSSTDYRNEVWNISLGYAFGLKMKK